MFTHGLVRSVSIVVLALAACAPLVPGSPEPQAVPSPAGDWTLKLTQTGGFAGVMLSAQVSSDGMLTATNERTGQTVTQALAPDQLARLARMYSSLRLTQPQPPHSACADCFLYSVEFSSGGQVTRLNLDDTTLADSGAADLIHLVQQLRDQALRSVP